MITTGDVAKENIKEQIDDWRFWISISDDLITHQPDPNKIYWYAKDPYKSKNWFLINKQKIKTFRPF